MEHVVFFTENKGQPEFRRVRDLEEAVRLVESLRNEHGIADVSVHALTPVPVSFRTYYRVEIGDAVAPADESVEEPAESSAEVPGLVAVEVSEVEVSEVEVSEVEVSEVEVVAVEVSTDEVESFESLALEEPALDVPFLADVAGSPSLSELPPPVEPAPVFDLDEPVEGILDAAEFDAAEFDAADFDAVDFDAAAAEVDAAEAPESEPVDEFESLASYDPLVPQVRPEPEAERSLGYFAN